MKIFIDSANIDEISCWLDCGIADGVTTNPSIMLKDGVDDIKKRSLEIAKLIAPLPLSVEVTSDVPEEMIKQGKEFASWAPNIVIKIPVITQEGKPCLCAIKALADAKIKVNATALLSMGQVALVTKAGATYASIFAGRIGDEGGDAQKVIEISRNWLDEWQYKTEIIVGSIRCVADIQSAMIGGAHILTIPPSFIGKMCDHRYTRDTVKQFLGDAQKSMDKLKKK